MFEREQVEGVDLERDDMVDVTEKVDCYEHGKTFECECGHGIGVTHGIAIVRCENCKKYCVDKEADGRRPPSRDADQASLSQWT
jgi:hypothetical protein